MRELLLAWKDQALPAGPYAATQLVPFPDPEGGSLIAKFPSTLPTEKIDRLLESVRWYVKVPWIGPGLGADHIRALVQALPEVMDQFRAQIASDLADPELLKRLAPGFVTGFRQVA